MWNWTSHDMIKVYQSNDTGQNLDMSDMCFSFFVFDIAIQLDWALSCPATPYREMLAGQQGGFSTA